MNRTFRGLEEVGLRLIGPDAPDFRSLARKIADRPYVDSDTCAVLLNQSEKAIVALAYIWRYTTAEGETRTSRHSNLGSGKQIDVLSGRTEAERDLCSFILPGSMRLITEWGIFGNNLDVLPADFPMQGGGFGRAGGFRRKPDEVIVEIDLSLDIAIFEDGLCAGPDESGLFESVTTDLRKQREISEEIVTAMRNGAPGGQIFELLRPLARREFRMDRSQLLTMFANSAIHQLVQADGPELRAWFESYAETPRIQLHRPK